MGLLPIDSLLPDVLAAMTGGSRLVLRAPPGAGKTTRVPAALLDAGVAGDKQIVVLEPRRIAARAAAQFVAAERGGGVGREVGYRVRFEQRGGAGTRLWFLTEGVLSRQLGRDPFLEEVGVVVLDEFHERHLQGDIALAVARELQETVRPDLKIAVMSATLETVDLARYLGGCAVLTSTGRAYPVEVDYEDGPDPRPLSRRVAAALQRLLGAGDDGGDVLVFLPGAAEIRRASAALAPLAAAHGLDVVPLHGDLPLEDQQRALRRGSRRKVVLSTNVAETALTIEGVTAVIDSGLARVARLDPRHGINRLRVVPISRASAEQRAGRAGRIAPGRCLRLWTEAEHRSRRERETPEISRLELSGTVLELHAWGLRDLRGFAWLDPPPESSLQQAEGLLIQLGAMDGDGGLTAIGRRLLELSATPRLGRILIEADRRGCAASAALLAALASERDICLDQRALGEHAESLWPAGPSDLLLRRQIFEEVAARHFDVHVCRNLEVDVRAARAVERARRQLARAIGADRSRHGEGDDDTLLRCVLAGFPDRLVRRRAAGSDRGRMVGRTGVVLAGGSVVREAELFVAVEIEATSGRQQPEALVRLASAVRREWLDEIFPGQVRQRKDVVFDSERERVVERLREVFRDLILREEVRLDVDRLAAGEVLADVARGDPETALRPSVRVRSLLARMEFLARAMPELALPSSGGEALSAVLPSLCAGRRSFSELRQIDLSSVLKHSLTNSQRQALEREAPDEYVLPSGRRVAVRYERGKPPAVAARIQEMFGLRATPRLAAGRVSLVIELLAPNQRPMQITDDVESFWRTTYPEVRKQLRGRYPKHDWPEDPLAAAPSSRPRRRRQR